MRHAFVLVPLLLVLLGGAACKGPQQTPARNPNQGNGAQRLPDTLAYIQAGACHGTCPIYSFVVYTNGLVDYNGKRFTDLIGHYQKTIEPQLVEKVRQILRNGNLAQFRPQYGESGNDFPSYRIVAQLDGTRTAVQVYHGAPEAFTTLFNQLRDAVGITDGYTLVGE